MNLFVPRVSSPRNSKLKECSSDVIEISDILPSRRIAQVSKRAEDTVLLDIDIGSYEMPDKVLHVYRKPVGGRVC